MAERTLSGAQDHRAPNVQLVCKYYPAPMGPNSPQRTVVFTNTKGNGIVKWVSGVTGGKYTPGTLKLRNFYVCTATYKLGSCSLHGEHVYGPASWQGSPRGTTGLERDLQKVPQWSEYDANIALYTQNKCFAKFSKPDEDVGAFLGELPETLRSLIKWGKGFRSLLKDVRKDGFTWERANRAWSMLKDGESLKKLPGQLSNAWLTWRYGIRPLFWDAQMLMKIAADRQKRSKAIGLRRRVARSTDELSRVIDGERVGINLVSYRTKISWTIKTKCETTVYYQLLGKASDLEWILHKYGLHPSQVPALLWELTPLSFVVDWFVDVQSWITGLQPPLDEKFIGWSTSQRRDLELTTLSTGLATDTFATSSWRELPTGEFPEDKLTVRSLTRKVGTKNPGILPAIRPNIALDVQKWTDLASLAFQRLKPKR